MSLDWNQTARVAWEEEKGQNRITGEPGGGGAMAGIEILNGVHEKTPTGHERINWEHGDKEKEMANVTRALVGAS